MRGLVKPVGGVPGKVEAAEHAGLSKVLIPMENRLERFEHTTIEVMPIETLDEALEIMLLPAETVYSETQKQKPGTLPAAVLSAEEHTAQGNG